MTANTVADTATRIRQSTENGQRVIDRLAAKKRTLSEALEDGRKAANKLLEKTRDNAEDLIYQTTRRVRRTPIRSVAIAFAAGALIGMLISRNARS
jgi:ElaB/YqjD/DUF883 family membrane-anchored ribosome-binding protein